MILYKVTGRTEPHTIMPQIQNSISTYYKYDEASNENGKKGSINEILSAMCW